MFGYVKPVQTELIVKDLEFYRAAYCGICRAMKKHTGALSNITLTYDSVFLALVRMLYIPDSEFSAHRKRCIAHPIKKRPMLDINSATEYTARAFAILSYYKMKDDILDEGFGKRLKVAPIRPILKSGAKRAGLSDVADVIYEKLLAIVELERAKTASVDAPAALFGELLGEVFANGLPDESASVLRELGDALGRFIYAADAAEDYEEDRRCGKYNPYVLIYNGAELTDKNKASIKCALLMECRRIEAAVLRLPFGKRYTIENIIKNIIYLGLPERIKFLDPKPSDEGDKKDKKRVNMTP